MTLLEAEIAFILVATGIYLALPVLTQYGLINIHTQFYLPLALLAGALASPTDPTAALAIKEEYKAEGHVTTTILGIAAFDDATGIINFSIASAVSLAVLGKVGGGLGLTILVPVAGIAMSVILGVMFAGLLILVARTVKDKGTLIVLILGALFVCFGIAKFFKLNELLSTMIFGCAIVNMAKDEEKFFISIRDYLEEIIFVVFFVLAGAHLQPGILKSSIVIVLIFIALRTAGKVFGAFLGGMISKAPANVKKYTAFGLIPQGGIVVGLALLVRQNAAFSGISLILLNIILGTTVLHEFLGPLLTEMALKKAGEIRTEK